MGSFFLSFTSGLRKISPRFGIPAAFLIAIFYNPQQIQFLLNDFNLPIGSVLVLIGLFLRIWVRGFVREEGFVVDGPYRYVRNPVELGTLLIYSGVCVALALEWWQQLIVVSVTFLYFEAIGVSNEADMKKALGDRYVRYKSRVRRWLPTRYPGMNRSGVTFSLVRGLFCEKDLIVFFAILVGFLSLKRYLLEQ